MNFGTIEIICRPCEKCRMAERILIKALRFLEAEFKTTYTFAIERTDDLRKADKYSANISSAPFIIINGNLAFAGKITDVSAVRFTLLSMMRSNRLPFK